jgi:hypothetical protein
MYNLRLKPMVSGYPHVRKPPYPCLLQIFADLCDWHWALESSPGAIPLSFWRWSHTSHVIRTENCHGRTAGVQTISNFNNPSVLLHTFAMHSVYICILASISYKYFRKFERTTLDYDMKSAVDIQQAWSLPSQKFLTPPKGSSSGFLPVAFDG